jgi:hypothetical protein
MRHVLFAVIALAAAGRLGGGTLPPAKNNDVALYGPVPIIRPGTKFSELAQSVGPPSATTTTGTFLCALSWYHDGLVIWSDGVKVGSAELKQVSAGGPNPRSPLEDACLELKLKTGLSARQVESILGPPKYGVETRAGNVELVYPEREVAVEYADGLLLCWRKTVVYKDRERNEQGPASPGTK